MDITELIGDDEDIQAKSLKGSEKKNKETLEISLNKEEYIDIDKKDFGEAIIQSVFTISKKPFYMLIG